MHRIVLAEDSEEVQILVKATLGRSHQVVAVDTVSSALQEVRASGCDLILIDIGLADGDGFSLCAQLKGNEATSHIPIIFLTSKNDIQNKLTAFSIGADDYILKPFEPLELRARVDAKLRKVAASKTADEAIWSGNLRILLPLQKVFWVAAGKDVDLQLSPNEFKLLCYFARREGHVLSRSVLLDNIWGRDISVVERTVDTHVCSLRKKLKSSNAKIESVFGEGYKYKSASLERLDQKPGPTSPVIEI